MESAVSWDDGRIETLKKLWADGLSASQIANELGGVTRNAVIGKVHRLGLSGRAKTKSASVARPRVKVQVKQQRMVANGGMRGSLVIAEVIDARSEVMPHVMRENVVVPISRRISIMELREGVCRWPMGDPLTSEFAYCGVDCGGGKTYCEYHARIAYQPQNERRRSS